MNGVQSQSLKATSARRNHVRKPRHAANLPDVFHHRLGRMELSGEIVIELAELVLGSNHDDVPDLSCICEMYDPDRGILVLNAGCYFALPEQLRKDKRQALLSTCLSKAQDLQYDLLMLAS